MEQKPKIDKADYMLLYVRINEVYDQLNNRTNQMERVFKFEHVMNRFTPSDHMWSADKNAVDNCYADLKQDEYYLIFAHRVRELMDKKKDGRIFHRWVWRVALNMTEKQIRAAYKFYLKNSDNPKLCGQFADSLVNPKIATTINEFTFD